MKINTEARAWFTLLGAIMLLVGCLIVMAATMPDPAPTANAGAGVAR